MPKTFSRPEEQYHHGDLRRCLIDQAIAFLRHEEPQKLSLRDLARQMNVSAGAPYHHFSDRTELLRLIAIEGFDRLLHRFREATKGKRSYEQKIAALTRAYLSFAREERSYYRTMFLSEIYENLPDDRLPKISTEAFEFIRNVIIQSGKGKPTDNPSDLTVALWSLFHGMVSLESTGALKRRLALSQENRVALLAVLRIVAADIKVSE